VASHPGGKIAARPWLPCTEKGCTKAQYYYQRCQQHFREYNRRNEGRKNERRREIRKNLPIHTRICIDCRKPFLSQRGFNVCLPCADKVMLIAGSRTLDKRGIKRIGAKYYHVVLNQYYGSKYQASHKPRIPLSTLGVFDAL
jgi:hypothetical protein